MMNKKEKVIKVQRKENKNIFHTIVKRDLD